MKGVVVKGIGGFYFVNCDGNIFRAKGRGILKKGKNLIYVGDNVEAFPPNEGDDDGIITEVFPRKNLFQRPPVSNIDILIITIAAKSPDPNLGVLDRMLVTCESKGIKAAICVNKIDLDLDRAMEIKNIYSDLYPTVLLSCVDEKLGDGLEGIKELISQGTTSLAGPSGVGKSTIINQIIPEAKMETGDLSIKGSRGKHTTRHVELFSLGEGFLCDTPGFTSLEVPEVSLEELAGFFPEIKEASSGCRFRNCMHISEPDCEVVKMVNEGKISTSRYSSYLNCVDEIKKG